MKVMDNTRNIDIKKDREIPSPNKLARAYYSIPSIIAKRIIAIAIDKIREFDDDEIQYEFNMKLLAKDIEKLRNMTEAEKEERERKVREYNEKMKTEEGREEIRKRDEQWNIEMNEKLKSPEMLEYLKQMTKDLKDFSIKQKQTIIIKLSEMFKYTDIKRGGNSDRNIKNAIDELSSFKIKIENEESYSVINVIKYGEWNKNDNTIEIEFNERFIKLLDYTKERYKNISLRELFSFRNFHALRIFEIAKSHESQAGKGTKEYKDPSNWFFEATIEELRNMLAIDKNSYKENRFFIKDVIKRACNEINSMDVSLKIEAKVIKHDESIDARRIEKIHFSCTKKGVIQKIFEKKKMPGVQKQIEQKDKKGFDVTNLINNIQVIDEPETRTCPICGSKVDNKFSACENGCGSYKDKTLFVEYKDEKNIFFRDELKKRKAKLLDENKQ